MRIYKVAVYCGQHETYYVHADDVATAGHFALQRDDQLAKDMDVETDCYRRITSVGEFCDAGQFAGPPVSFVKRRAT